MDKPQSIANHRVLPLVHLFAGVVLSAELMRRAWDLIATRDLAGIWSVLFIVALLIIWNASRRNAQIIQDRIIRLEVRERLERVLPPAQRGDIARLKLPQLVGLRFASDGELAGLAREAIEHDLPRDEIKRRIKNWQADWLRV